MNASKKCSIGLACLLAGWAIAGDSMNGGRFELVGVVTSGASRLAGGNYGVFGVADFGAHVLLSGGSFELLEGFLDGADISEDVRLSVDVTSGGLVELTWPVSATGFVLEAIPSLEADQVWQLVTPTSSGATTAILTSNRLITSTDGIYRFYRLRRP